MGTASYQTGFWLPVVVLTLAANAAVWLELPLAVREVAAALLIFVVVGAAWVRVVFPHGWIVPLPERLALSAGASVALAVWLLWLLFLLPLRLEPGVTLAALDLAILLLAVLAALRAWRQTAPAHSATPGPPIRLRREVTVLIILTVVTVIQLAYARANAHVAELVYDERVVMFSVVNVLLGKKDSLFDMPRGSAQVLLAMWFARLTGSLTEEAGRLPFALCAGIAAGTFTLIARMRFHARMTLLLGLLFCFEGLLLSLARWLQYQIFVLAMMQLAVYCALRAWATRKSVVSNRYWILCALFEGLALLGHYDAAFMGPALVYLFLRAHDRPWLSRRILLKAAAVGGAIALLSVPYYLMLVQYPDTMSRFEFLYVRDSGRLGLSRAPFNNLNTFFWDAMYFGSVYRLPVMAVGLAVAVLAPFRGGSLSGRVRGAWLACALLVVLTIWQPDALAFGGVNFSVLPYCLLFLLGCWKIVRDPYWVAILLWLFAVFLVAGFFMDRPVDHYFSGLPPLLLVAGKGLAELATTAKRLVGRQRLRFAGPPAYALCGAWLAVIAVYLYLQAVVYLPATLLRHPELTPPFLSQLANPRGLLPSTRMINEGWRTVAALYETGELRGEHDTNIGRAAEWYVYNVWDPPQPRPRYFIESALPNPRDVTSAKPLDFADTFELWGSIVVAGEPGLTIYQRSVGGALPAPRIVQAADFDALWPQIMSLTRLERFKTNQRDDSAFYALARALQVRARAGDAVAFGDAETSALLNLYYSGRLPYVTPSALNSGGYQRVWGVFWPTAGGPVEQALAQTAYPLTAEWFGNVRLRSYGMAPDAPLAAVGARLGDVALLRQATSLPPSVKAGAWLPLRLEWQAGVQTDVRYKVFVHIADAQGVPVAQADGEPATGLRPTIDWHPGDVISDRIGIELPASLKPGEYRVLVGLYDATPGGARLPALDPDGSRYANDSVPIGRVTVVSN